MVSESDRQRFRTEGICVLRSVIDENRLVRFREECAYFIGYKDASMDHKGINKDGITHRGSRYFISRLYENSQFLQEFLFGDLMAAIVGDLLGDEAYLFNEQWVVKGAYTGMKFSWHQDSGYWGLDPAEVVTAWIAFTPSTRASGANKPRSQSA